jgi:hypothetical protein
MTAGRGFIAMALVIFSKWQPLHDRRRAPVPGGRVSLELHLRCSACPSRLSCSTCCLPLGLAVLAVWSGARRSAAPGGWGECFSQRRLREDQAMSVDMVGTRRILPVALAALLVVWPRPGEPLPASSRSASSMSGRSTTPATARPCRGCQIMKKNLPEVEVIEVENVP